MEIKPAEPHESVEPVSRLQPRHRFAPSAAVGAGEEVASGGTAAERQPGLPSGSKPLVGLRVLVCEDDPDSRELLQAVLLGEGATVCVAAAAIEALDHFQEFRPDVVVSDIGMPVMDGYALIRRIREFGEKEGGRTPAIALTAYAGREDARRAFAAGYQLHVPKPVDPDELAGLITSLVGRSGRDVRTQ